MCPLPRARKGLGDARHATFPISIFSSGKIAYRHIGFMPALRQPQGQVRPVRVCTWTLPAARRRRNAALRTAGARRAIRVAAAHLGAAKALRHGDATRLAQGSSDGALGVVFLVCLKDKRKFGQALRGPFVCVGGRVPWAGPDCWRTQTSCCAAGGCRQRAALLADADSVLRAAGPRGRRSSRMGRTKAQSCRISSRDLYFRVARICRIISCRYLYEYLIIHLYIYVVLLV